MSLCTNYVVKRNNVDGVENIVKMPFSEVFINFPSGEGIIDDTKSQPTLPVQWAAVKSNPYILQMLLNAGADVNKKFYEPAIEILLKDETVDANEYECIKILIEYNANLYDNEGYPYSIYAAGQCPYDGSNKYSNVLSTEILKIYKAIIKAYDKRMTQDIQEELIAAVRANNYLIVEYILCSNNDININYRDRNGNTALSYLEQYNACDDITLKIKEILINNGAESGVESQQESI